MSAMSWIASRGNSVGFLLATRYLARDPAFYSAPLVLLILTLSPVHIHGFPGADAGRAPVRQQLLRRGRGRYAGRAGSHHARTRSALVKGRAAAKGKPTPQPQAAAATPSSRRRSGSSCPSLSISACRRSRPPPASVNLTPASRRRASWTDAQFLGVDRLDFPKAAYWRYDFAPASLGALMNALAVTPDGILLPRKFMRENAIRVGEPIQVRVVQLRRARRDDDDGRRRISTTSQPGIPRTKTQSRSIVGNLEHFFEQAGGVVPYDVWVKTAEGADYEKVSDRACATSTLRS